MSIRALRWSAVDLDAAKVTFGRSTAVVRGRRVEGATKGGPSRTVSLDRETVTVLREHRQQQTEKWLAAGCNHSHLRRAKFRV